MSQQKFGYMFHRSIDWRVVPLGELHQVVLLMVHGNASRLQLCLMKLHYKSVFQGFNYSVSSSKKIYCDEVCFQVTAKC